MSVTRNLTGDGRIVEVEVPDAPTAGDMEAEGVGGVMRALAAVLIDRGHDPATVIERVIEDAGRIESDLWDRYLGPAADEVARAIGLEPYPTGEEVAR